MKKIIFTLFALTISFQVHSQNSQTYFHELRNEFMQLHFETYMIRDQMSQLEQYSSLNSSEHGILGHSNLQSNWNNIRSSFSALQMHFTFIRDAFAQSEFKFGQLGDLLGSFNGSYTSLSGLPSLFDGNFSSLSGTPTTLAGYGITDGFSGSYADLSSKPTFRDLSSSNPVVFGSLDAFSGTFSNRATLDVVADSNGNLITGYKNGASGDRFNVKLDATAEKTIVSSGGGFGLKLYSESGQMIFEGMDMDATPSFSFNGDATFAGDLNVNSDARLKANIISLGSTLAKLLQIDGKTYTMKKDVNETQKIGLLAQDIEKVFPELVSENNGIKSVNYQGLVPVLINALKDQQSEINELKSMVYELIQKNK